MLAGRPPGVPCVPGRRQRALRGGPHSGPDTGRFLDVFTPEGRHRARVDLGHRLVLLRAMAYRSGILYGVTRDELDVESVVGLDLRVAELAR